MRESTLKCWVSYHFSVATLAFSHFLVCMFNAHYGFASLLAIYACVHSSIHLIIAHVKVFDLSGYLFLTYSVLIMPTHSVVRLRLRQRTTNI